MHRSNSVIWLKKCYQVIVLLPFGVHQTSPEGSSSSSFSPNLHQVDIIIILISIKRVQFYHNDLLDSNIVDEVFSFEEEVDWWSLQLHPQNFQDCLTPWECKLPNHSLAALCNTSSTCSCERSASALRRLNSYLQCTQIEYWLTAAALMWAYYSKSVSGG